MSPADFDAWVAKVKQSPDKLDAAAYAQLAEPSRRHPVTYYSAVEPGSVRRASSPNTPGGHQCTPAATRRPQPARRLDDVRQTDHRRAAVLQRDRRGRRRWSRCGGGAGRSCVVITWLGLALSLDRVADQRRPQAHRHHVHRAGADHAAARLRRRDHDARPAGDRAELRRLSAARAFRPDLQLARHHHDLLHGDAVPDRADQHRRAAADRRARRRLPVPEFAQPVADRGRRRRWSWSRW